MFCVVRFVTGGIDIICVSAAKHIKTRNTGSVHTSAKGSLTRVAIWIRIQIPDPDLHQNLIVCSMTRCQPSLKNFM